MVSASNAASGIPLPARVQAYLDALAHTCEQDGPLLVSVILFGSTAKGSFSEQVSDVDLIIVVSDDASRATRRGLGEAVARLETLHGLRSAAAPTPGGLRAFIERLMAHDVSCFICTRDDVISGDMTRMLGLRPLEKLFVDRIVLASIVASAVTVRGEDLLRHVPLPSIRRLDVFKALFGFCGQVMLSAVAFPALPEATRYAMGTLKHSLHNCFFCYHRRTAPLEQEVEFFQRQLGANRTLKELLALRRQYRPSFGFVIRCLPVLVRLHVRTARDNRFPSASVL